MMMKTILAVPLYLSLTLLVSCRISNKQEQLLENYFSDNEIKDLTTIVAMVDSVVLSKTKLIDIDVAYPAYLDSLCQRGNRSGITSCSHKSLFDSVIKRIDTDLANEIFMISQAEKIIIEDTALIKTESWTKRDFNIESRLMKYFQTLEKNESYFREAIPQCLMQGGIAPAVRAYILCTHETIDFNDFNNRLWVSIILLTIYDPIDLNERE